MLLGHGAIRRRPVVASQDSDEAFRLITTLFQNLIFGTELAMKVWFSLGCVPLSRKSRRHLLTLRVLTHSGLLRPPSDALQEARRTRGPLMSWRGCRVGFAERGLRKLQPRPSASEVHSPLMPAALTGASKIARWYSASIAGSSIDPW